MAFTNISVQSATRTLNQAQTCMYMLSQTYYYWQNLNVVR